VINNGDEGDFLSPRKYEDFLRMYKLEVVDSGLDMGQPHMGMCCHKTGIRLFNSAGLIKFELPWIVSGVGIDGDNLWCDGHNTALEKESYTTAFNEFFF
jgi:hypothetical protein